LFSQGRVILAGAAASFGVALVLASVGDSRVSIWFVVAALLGAAVVWFEGGPDSAKEITLVATLAGAAAAGRVLFAAVPGVQPVTLIAIVAGAALGLRAGVGVGMLAAFASNFFLAQGPWTPFQMLGWGACGALGALLAPLLRRRLALTVTACILGLAFSAFMDAWEWFAFWPHDWRSFTLVLGRGFPFDVAHAIGNVVLALAVGPELRRLLERYGRRLHAEVVWA
jgi:energy-coupling factor transport system substrate-specific component